MIAYIIQCYSQLDHIPVLLDWLAAPDNRYVICVNPRSADRFDLCGALSGRSDVHVTNSVPVTWGGESLMIAMLDGIAEALRTFDGWEYAVNLSETCFPLQSQAALFDFLSSRRAAGITDFLHYFGPVAPRDLAGIAVTGDLEDILPLPRSDTRIRSDRALRDCFTDISASPIINPDLRPAIHTSEAGAGEVVCRPLHRIERIARRSFLEENPLYVGRAWYVFSRPVCEWLATSSEAARIFEFLKSVYNPDECYLQTALLSPASPVRREAVEPHNLRFADGHPHDLTDRHLAELAASDRFFARKLMLRSSPQLIDWIYTATRRAAPARPPTSNDPAALDAAQLQQLWEKGRFADGAKLLEGVDLDADTDPAFLHYAGLCLAGIGDERRAIGLLKRAAEIGYDRFYSAYHLAHGEMRGGNAAEAAFYFTVAAILDPPRPEIPAYLRSLAPGIDLGPLRTAQAGAKSAAVARAARDLAAAAEPAAAASYFATALALDPDNGGEHSRARLLQLIPDLVPALLPGA